MKKLIPLLFLVAMCASPTAPVTWPGRQIEPRPEWRTLWGEVERCVGRTRDFDGVRWFESPDGSLGDKVVGRWESNPPHDDIYLIEWAVQINLEATVAHEAAHAILQTGEHGVLFYQCGLMS